MKVHHRALSDSLHVFPMQCKIRYHGYCLCDYYSRAATFNGCVLKLRINKLFCNVILMWIGSVPAERGGIGEGGWIYVHGEKHILSLTVSGPLLPLFT